MAKDALEIVEVNSYPLRFISPITPINRIVSMERAARLSIGLGLVLGLLGHCVSLIPNADHWWFLFAASFALLGGLSRNLDVRLLAILVAAVWIGDAMRHWPQ